MGVIHPFANSRRPLSPGCDRKRHRSADRGLDAQGDDDVLCAEPLEFGLIGRDLRDDLVRVADVRFEPPFRIAPGGEGRFDPLSSSHGVTLPGPRVEGRAERPHDGNGGRVQSLRRADHSSEDENPAARRSAVKRLRSSRYDFRTTVLAVVRENTDCRLHKTGLECARRPSGAAFSGHSSFVTSITASPRRVGVWVRPSELGGSGLGDPGPG